MASFNSTISSAGVLLRGYSTTVVDYGCQRHWLDVLVMMRLVFFRQSFGGVSEEGLRSL
jgi:hypothetical protein